MPQGRRAPGNGQFPGSAPRQFPGPQARERALFRIAEGTYHQQTADEATPHVVPVLIELVADRATPNRARLLAFIAGLLSSQSLDLVADHDADDRRIEKKIREYEAMPDSPTSFYQARWRDRQTAAWGEAKALFGLLEDREAEVRAHAGLVLAVLVKEGAAGLLPEAPGLVASRLRESIAGIGQLRALATALPAEHPDRGRVLALFGAAGDRLLEERRASVRRMRKKLGPGPAGRD